MKMMRILTFLVIILMFHLSESKTMKLGGGVELSWTVEEDSVEMEVRSVLAHHDWLAIGFSDYGDLNNADFCVLWRDWTEKLRVSDVFTNEESRVITDKKQDCKNSKWRKGRTESGKEEMVWVFTRGLDTCDAEDYKIEEGTTHLLWALGRGPLYNINGVNISDKDSVLTGLVRLRLLGPPTPDLPAGLLPLRVKADQVHLPTEDTFYACSVHRLPAELRQKHSMVQYEAEIQEGNEDVVHHMEVFHCPIFPGENQEFPVWSGSCSDPKAPPELSQCKKVLAAWAIGAGPFTYPEEAGLTVGGDEFHPYVLLEVHYNNKNLRSGVVDSSGLKLHLTEKLRKYEAGIMELGLIYNNWMAVPPGQQSFILQAHCAPQCTAMGLETGGILVFGSQLHTHGAGRQVRSEVVRRGRAEMLNEDPHYSTHFQEIRTLRHPVRVLPGDSLVTTCTYNTAARLNITLGGFGFREEMCVNYIHYYPRVNMEICKSSVAADELRRYFDNLREDENQETHSEQSIADNYNAIDWTKRRARDLRDFYAESRIKMQCQTGAGSQLPGDLSSIKIPRVEASSEGKKEENCQDAGNTKKYLAQDYIRLQDKQNIFKTFTKNFGDIEKRIFFKNSFQDEWADYDAWGLDKRADDSMNDVDTNEGHVHMNHMGKRKLGSM